MGREIVRVPPGFRHPTDESGSFIPGAHYEVLYKTDPALRTAYQVYENVTEGSPVSPVCLTADTLIDWLLAQGISHEAAEAFLRQGFAPSFVVKSHGEIVPGIESAKELRGKS